MIVEKDAEESGWDKENGEWMPKTTGGSIAPESVIELISCGCRGKCQRNCRCGNVGQICTDFCRCGDLCENVGPVSSMQPSTLEEDVSEE